MINTKKLREAADGQSSCDLGSHSCCDFANNTYSHEEAADEIDANRARIAELEAVVEGLLVLVDSAYK